MQFFVYHTFADTKNSIFDDYLANIHFQTNGIPIHFDNRNHFLAQNQRSLTYCTHAMHPIHIEWAVEKYSKYSKAYSISY